MSKSQSSVTKILILVILLAVPGFLYYLLQEKGQNRYKKLAIYGEKQVASTFHTKRGKKIPDTVYHTIREFKLVNQLGDTVQFPSPTPKITLANFFYTSCPSVCKTANQQMQRMYDRFKENNLLDFISITVDPQKDTPAVLAAYAKTYNADAAHWNFLTGDKASIYALARKSFLVDALQDSAKAGSFIHSPMLVLVDTRQRIRGFYDSGRKESMDQLMDEIKVLITEELREVKNR